MTPSIESRIHILAARELEELDREGAHAGGPVARLRRLESRARSLFLMEDRELDEVRGVLASHGREWLDFVRSDGPWAAWTSLDRPQAGEHLMEVCDLLISGLLMAIAKEDDESVATLRSRLDREPPEPELALATLLLAQQLCLLYGAEFQTSAEEMDRSWSEWIELELVHPGDDTWNGVRAIARGDAEAVHAALRSWAEKRRAALRYAAESGRMLRGTLPARLALQMDSAALARLARRRGMELSLQAGDLLTRRALALWRLD